MITIENREHPHIKVHSDADEAPSPNVYGIVMECDNCGASESKIVLFDYNKALIEQWRDRFVQNHRDCTKNPTTLPGGKQ